MSKKTKLAGYLLLQALLLVLLVGSASANRGREIIEIQDKMDDGFHDEVSRMDMVLINANGEKNVRRMIYKRFEMKDDGDKSISKFLKPKDIKGTGLLTYEHKEGDDDQWLYLPALKRVKRISSRNKSGSYMGSEFSYEDLASFEIEKFTYKYINDSTLDDWRWSLFPKSLKPLRKRLITIGPKIWHIS